MYSVETLEQMVQDLEHLLSGPTLERDDAIVAWSLLGRLDDLVANTHPLRPRIDECARHRETLLQAVSRMLAAGHLQPMIERGDAVVDAAEDAVDAATDPVLWALDLLTLISVRPIVNDAGRAELDRLLLHADLLLRVYPERFVDLPPMAARRFEDEPGAGQHASVAALLHRFGEVALDGMAFEAIDGPQPGDTLLPAVATALERLPGRVVPLPYEREFQSARSPQVQRGAVIRIAFGRPPSTRLAAAVPVRLPADLPWTTLYEDDEVWLRATELMMDESESEATRVLAVYVAAESQLDLRTARYEPPSGDGHPATSDIRRSREEWVATIQAQGRIDLVCGERRIGLELVH